MKRILTMLAVTAMVVGSTNARDNALERAMEDYARDLLRAHPEVAGEKKTREAREEIYNDARSKRLLDLTKEDEKKLRKREDMMPKGEYSAAVERIKALNSKDPNIIFLIKYAEDEKIKPAEKLLAYRLIKDKYTYAAEKAAEEQGKRLFTILTKYTEYKKNNNGKAPASLNDLDLPEDCKKFTNSKGQQVDWIYIGHLGAALKANNTHIVIAEPEPRGAARVCGLDNGEIARFQNNSMQGHLDKLANAKASGSSAGGGSNATIGGAGNGAGGHPSSAAIAGLMKKFRIFRELNNKKYPASLAELNLTPEESQYTDPTSKKKSDWIYLGKKSKIGVGEGVTVVVAAPMPHGGKRLIGLSNGKIGNIKDSQISSLLNK